MSETATPSPESTPAKDKPAKPPRTRGQKWRRRIIVALSVFIIGVFVARALVPMLLPTVLRQVAGTYGLTAEYDELDFSMLGGDVGIWNLRFTPKEGGEPLMSIGYCRGSVSTIGLLRGRLNVDRAEAEDARVTLERLADGTIPQLTRFLPPPDPTTPAATPTGPTNIPLEPPLTVRTLRLQQAEARLIDRAVAPETDVRLRLNLMLNDIGSLDRPTSFSVQLDSPELLGAMYVNGSATARNKLVNADLDLRMIGFNPQPLVAYLGAFGIAPTAADISGSAKGKLTMTPAAGATTQPAAVDAPVTAVAIKLELTDIDLTADSVHAAAVRNVLIDIPTASPGEVRIKDVRVEGVRAYAWRDEQGRPGFAGFALGAAPTTTTKAPAPTTAPAAVAAAPAPAPASASGPFIVELQTLFVRDTRLQFVDRAIAETPTFSLVVPEVTLKRLSTDPAHADIPSTLAVTARAPGLAHLIVLGGDIAAAKAQRSIDLKLNVSGIDGSALDPYLKPLGVTRAMRDASFAASLTSTIEPRADGSLLAGIHLKDVRFKDAEHEWFAFSKVNIADVAITENARRIRFGNIDVRGPALTLTRASDGAVTAFGFTYDPTKAQPATPVSTAAGTPAVVAGAPATQPTGAVAALPVIEVGTLTWSELGLNVNDAMSVPPVAFSLADVKVEVLDLTLDPTAVNGKPGRVSASIVSPGNIDRLTATGTVSPTGEAIAFNISGDGEGVTLAGLRPILNSLGLDPILNAGKLKFAIGGDARRKDGAMSANVSVRGTSLSDASGEWLAVDELKIFGATFDGTTAGVEEIAIVNPTARVSATREGRLAAAGVRLITPPNSPPPAPVDPTAPPVPSTIDLTLPVVAKLNKLSVTDAQVSFTDRGVAPTVVLKPTINVVLKDVVAGTDADPATLDATVQIPGVIEKLTAKGNLLASPTRQSIEMTVKGTGVSGTAIQPYLPPAIAPSTAAGTLNAWFSAQLRRNAAGGSHIDVQASDIAFNDGLRPEPAFKLDSAKFVVDRFDLPGKVIAIQELSTSGLAARVYEEDRGLVLPGLVVLSNPPAPIAPPAKAQKPDMIAKVGEAIDVEKLKEAARIKPPLVTIARLNLGAQRLSFQSKQMAYPLAAKDLSLTGNDIRVLGEDPTKQPPFTLTARGGVEKLVDALSSTATLAPFATDPSANIKVSVTGIHANEVTTLLPALGKLIDGKGLDNGSFNSELEAQFSFVRSGLFGIDLDRDISSTFTVRNTALTQAGVEKPLAGVQEVRAEQVRVSPRTGNVAIKSLDLVKPAAQIVRDEQGITALGMMLKLPTAPATQPATQAAEEPAVAAAPEPAATQPVAVADATSTPMPTPIIDQRADVSVGSLTVTGIDLVIEDRVGKPTTVLPITELDLEVKGLNTQALRQELPVKFSVLAGSGKTAFTKEDGTLTEPREIFAQFGASGQVTVFPKPNGYIKSSLSGFELRSVKGIAQQIGIELGNGTFDFALDARMEGADTFNAKLYPTFNSLRMKDSADGKVSRFLKIGAPLDVALVAVADADDAISIPVTVPFEAGKLNVGSIIGSVAGSVGGQVAKAIVAAPLKLAAMAGLNFAGEKDLSPVNIAFAPGESMLTAAQQAQVQQVSDRLKADATLEAVLTHTLASGDFVLTEQRANPSSDDASSLATQLRQQKFDLQKQRVELAATLNVALASQNPSLAEQTLARLQQASTQLMRTEESLDDMLGLLKPGAARQADRRSKQASIDLGNYRLLSVEERLLASAPKDLAARISKARPTAKLDGAPALGQVEIKFARRAKQ